MTTYAANIRPLFRQQDIDCMAGKGVGLADPAWMCDPAHAASVYAALSSGKMPPDARWPAACVALFKAWMDQGCNP